MLKIFIKKEKDHYEFYSGDEMYFLESCDFIELNKTMNKIKDDFSGLQLDFVML